MIRGLAIAAAVAAVVAGLYLMSMNAAKSTLLVARSEPAVPELREPEIVLRDVEVREIRVDGRWCRLLSDNASYSVDSRRMSADGVTLTVREGRDRIVVRAPRALWSMDEGRIELTQGATAETGPGWSAVVPEARLDLRSQVLVAREATLSMPGLRVAGDNLVWRWEEGNVDLQDPRSRLFPGKLGAAVNAGEER